MTQQQTAPEGVHLLSVGAFGIAVARYLKAFRRDLWETVVTDESTVQPKIAHVTVVAAWRPVPKLCELVDELSFEWQRPFIPVMVESAALRLGPVVIPGRGACWHCWTARSRQHSELAPAQLALLQHYTSNPEAGPQGYLEPFAMMAAARIAQIIEELDSSAAIPGYVWQIDMMTRAINTSMVVGVHGCPRCGIDRLARELGFAEMQRELSYLWLGLQELQRPSAYEEEQ